MYLPCFEQLRDVRPRDAEHMTVSDLLAAEDRSLRQQRGRSLLHLHRGVNGLVACLACLHHALMLPVCDIMPAVRINRELAFGRQRRVEAAFEAAVHSLQIVYAVNVSQVLPVLS